jgi:hypothetical protein
LPLVTGNDDTLGLTTSLDRSGKLLGIEPGLRLLDLEIVGTLAAGAATRFAICTRSNRHLHRCSGDVESLCRAAKAVGRSLV